MKYTLVNSEIQKDFVKSLLTIRGIKDVEAFLNPTKDVLQDPENLENIEQGAKLLLSILQLEKPLISIVTDCDVDGFTSAAIIYNYIKMIKPEASLICHLHTGKAHGLEDCWEEVMQDNSNLIILPDASSNDYEYHIKFNIPILILDHHEVEDTQFSSNAIIINNQISPKYINKGLTGAGVAYQFCRMIDKIIGKDYAEGFIDLAALGIIADMGSLLYIENQYIVKTGLRHIQNIMFKETVIKQAYSLAGNKDMPFEQIQELLTPDKISFYVTPLYNAMIRIGTMEEKYRLFYSFIDGNSMVPCHKRGAAGTLERISIESLRECTNVKNKQKKMREEIASNLEMRMYKDGTIDDKMLFIVLNDNDTFQPELNGLIAMEIVSKYKRPTLIGRKQDGFIKGSGRGMDTSQLKDYNFHENEYPVNLIAYSYEEKLLPFIQDIGQHENIWGSCNPEPKLCIKNLALNSSNVVICGTKRDTIKVTDNGIVYMFFNSKDLIDEYEQKGSLILDIVGTAKLNHFRGIVTPQILVNNYSPCNSNPFTF